MAGNSSMEESFNVINRFVAKIVTVISDKITTEIRDQVATEVKNEVRILEPQTSEVSICGVLPSILSNPLPQ